MKSNSIARKVKGYTLIELLVIVVIVGVLSAVVSPNCLGAIARARLNNANYDIYLAMRQAQRNAMRERELWQASFREQNGIVQWAIHPDTVNPSQVKWNNLHQDIQLDLETTLEESNGVRRVKFNHRGNVAQPPLGRITITLKNHSQLKRCVFISTIIGTIRMSKEHPIPKEGNYCY